MEFDMASFVADTSDARKYLRLSGQTDSKTQRQVTLNMLSNAVLDVARYPAATFEVDSMHVVRKAGNGAKAKYELSGDLTLHGVSQALRLSAEGTEERAGYLHLVGNFSIKQTAFGITPYSKALGAVGVADALQVYGDLWIITDPTAARAGKARGARGR